MKKINRYIFMAFAVIFTTILFSGCASKKQGTDLVRSDEDGLIEVHINKGGDAWIVFNYDKWEKLPNYKRVSETAYISEAREGKHPIGNLSGPVRDACIGKLDILAANYYDDFTLPTVILLMEDGGVSWVYADPFSADPFSWDLPLINDIVSLSWEAEGEGIGDMTIFAKNSAGLVYDMRRICNLKDIFEGTWISEIETGAAELYQYLTFSEDGSVTLQNINFEGNILDHYTGTFRFFLAEDGAEGKSSDTISFDLNLDTSISDVNSPRKIKGEYRSWHDGITPFNFMLSEGDALYTLNGIPIEVHRFVMSYYGDDGLDAFSMSDEEFVEYILKYTPKAREMVEDMGMSVLVTGEISYLGEHIGECRDAWVGTNHNDNFVREILFSMSRSGEIYEYDPIGDGWNTASEWYSEEEAVG